MANAPKLYYKLQPGDQNKALEDLRHLLIGAQLTESQVDAFTKCDYFWKAPASFKFHSNFEGGLVYHSLAVALRLEGLLGFYRPDLLKCGACLDRFNPYKVALCHDICKAFYNRQNPQGEWYYDATALPGHAEASIMICAAEPFGITFTTEELLAIRWHMGPYCLEKPDLDAYDKAIDKSHKLAWLMHTADMAASRFDEKIYPVTVRKEWEN